MRNGRRGDCIDDGQFYDSLILRSGQSLKNPKIKNSVNSSPRQLGRKSVAQGTFFRVDNAKQLYYSPHHG